MLVPVFVKERLYVPRAPEFEQLLEELRSLFTYANPTYSKLKNLKKWTGSVPQQYKTWSHVSTPDWGDCLTLPRGGTNRVRKVFDKYGLRPLFIDRRLSLPPITNLYNDVTLRPDQKRLVEVMLKIENCIIRSPTGSGKTEVGLKLAELILKVAGPVLVVVWDTNLLNQWIQRICKRFGIRENQVGIIGKSKRRLAPITVAMQQTLLRQGHRYAHNFGGVICDEIQRFAAPTFQEVIDYFSARYRIGISADETRKDRKEFLIYDAFGEVADEIEKASLVAEGKIHEVVVRIVPTMFNYEIDLDVNGVRKSVEWNDIPPNLKDYNDFTDKLTHDEERNDLVWSFMEPCLRRNTCFVLTSRREHVVYWDNRIRAAGYTSGVAMGGDEREFDRTIAGLKNRTIAAGVGTIGKGGTGHDIPQIDRGFVTVPLAGNKQLFGQVTGRFTRPCEGKTEAVVYYFWDQYCYPHHKNIIRRLYPETYVWIKDQFLPA